jgi:pimeloyl-ACP methyl ester carboxylesterase
VTAGAAPALNAVSLGGANRRTILFVHGMAGTAGLWVLGYAFRLVKDYHVVAYDQRGHGLSPAPPCGYGLADHADDLERIRLRHTDGPVVVVGYSYGGHIASQWAMRYPQSAAGLVIVDTPPLPVAARDIDDMLDGVSAVLGGDFSPSGGFIDPLKESLRGDIQRRRRALMNVKGRLDVLKQTRFRQEVLSDRPFSDAAFQGIACKTALVYSSRAGHHAYARRQQALIRDCDLAILEGGHDFVIERADAVAAALQAFLADLPGAAWHPAAAPAPALFPVES